MLENLNYELFKLINNVAKKSTFMDYTGIFFAKYLVYGFVLYPLFLWFRKDKTYKNIALNIIYSSALGLFFNFLIGKFYYHPRPFAIHKVNLLIKHITDNSFPSDHTTFMLSMAFSLLYDKRTRMSGIILSVLGFFAGFARVFCGVHFPMDIIGSSLIALASSIIIFCLRDRLIANKFIINFYNKMVEKND